MVASFPNATLSTLLGSLNPLHCGAVVASRYAPLESPRLSRLNPLHCGAVVASRWYRLWTLFAIEVSIPFIAGQWSLRLFWESLYCFGCVVSIPFIAGQWSLRLAASNDHVSCSMVSIPFIAGQWSLLGPSLYHRPRITLSQSPSLRGSGRFAEWNRAMAVYVASFNPLHCGAVVASI